MQSKLLKIECLTNLHIGSGDINFNVIDNEVEKDITDYPVMHASGVKGAFRDAFSGDVKKENIIFGGIGEDNACNAGTYKFFDARFLARPLRVGGNPNISFVLTTTVAALNDLLATSKTFGCNNFGSEVVDNINFGEYDFLVSDKAIKNIEGSGNIGPLDKNIKAKLEKILGKNFAIARDINEYSLPVIARNCLDEEKRNLWYEEYVPHHSLFWLIVLFPDKEDFALDISNYIQFGGNASIGYGYTKVSEF